MKAVKICFYLRQDTRTRAGVNQVVKSLQLCGLSPDYFSPTETSRESFDEAEFGRIAEAHTFDRMGYFIGRARSQPRWSGYLEFSSQNASYLDIEIKSGPLTANRKIAPRLDVAGSKHWYNVGTELCRALNPKIGFCFTMFGVLPYDSFYMGIDPDRFGLWGLYARNWLCPWLVERIGADRLSTLTASTRHIGTELEIDLVPEPWAATWEEVFAASTRANEALRDSMVLGDYEDVSERAPPLGWAGIP